MEMLIILLFSVIFWGLLALVKLVFYIFAILLSPFILLFMALFGSGSQTKQVGKKEEKLGGAKNV